MTNGSGPPVKWGWATRCVPSEDLGNLSLGQDPPRIGDLAVGRVVSIGRHTRIEGRQWRRLDLFPDDLVGGVFGNRYATDQFEGYVEPFGKNFHILGIGGVFGIVRSQNARMPEPPTVMQLLGYAARPDGSRLSMLDYGLPRTKIQLNGGPRCRTILVVGSSMNSGKTTTAAYTVLGLTRAGHKVCAAKVTGTACAKDPGIFVDAGAHSVLDFSDCGWPSTYLTSLTDLLDIYARMRAAMLREQPDFIVLEVADGIWQRETDLLLTSSEFCATIEAVIFTGADSVSAESGVRRLRDLGYRVAAVSGLVSSSTLGMNEVSHATHLPCLSKASLANGALQSILLGG